MDFHKAEPGSDDLETSLSHAFGASGLPVRLSEALADPIVKVLMAADGVDPKGLEELLRGTAARLALRDQTESSSCATQRNVRCNPLPAMPLHCSQRASRSPLR